MSSSRVSSGLWAAPLGLALAPIVATLLFAACSKDEEDRKSLAGESCLTGSDCAAPLLCVDNVCVSGDTDGGTDGAPDAPVGDGPSADGAAWGACDECLDTACSAELAACDLECQTLEACIEVLCSNLSTIGSPDEGACQASCQSAYPAGKDPHLAAVECAINAVCAPPCLFYPDDYDDCRIFMNQGDCAAQRAACEASSDCQTYRDCARTCGSLAACLACDDSPEKLDGRHTLEAYEVCIAAECLSESWIP
jgi:hypothetical protein